MQMDEEYIKNEFLSCEVCEVIPGTNTDVVVNKNECEMRVVIMVVKKRSVRLWGQVFSSDV